MYVEVFIDKSIRQIDQLFTYCVPESFEKEIEIGKRIIVPFGKGNREEMAVVIRISDSAETETKDILSILDKEPVLSPERIALGMKMREKYLLTYHQAFSWFLPKSIIGEMEERYYLQENSSIEGLKEKFGNKEYLTYEEVKDIPKIKIALESGEVQRSFQLKQGVKKKKDFVYWINPDRKKTEKMNEKQRRVLEYLEEKGPLSQKEIMMDLQISPSPIQTLEKKEWILKKEKKPEVLGKKKSPVQLNQEQKQVVERIENSEKKKFYLHGVTGSGKTEVYMELAKKVLEKNQSVLILLPEIGLTPQITHRFQERFGNILSVIHSRLSYGEKAEAWIKILQQESRIIIGARSAIFAPIQNLGLIVVDEEHEESYGYHNALRYDTREVAEMLSEIEGARCVFGSATPSVNAFYRGTEKKEFEILTLSKRGHEKAKPPKVEIVDMREELERGNVSIFSEKLFHGIQKAMEQKKQGILFLNRRGYSHFVSCRSCGHVMKCENCDISMTYHQNIGRLRCHYCGKTEEMPKTCPVCGSKYLKQFGIGTEQVEEFTRKMFPKARIRRMDRDTMTEKGSYENLYQDMREGKIDILIGTQMLAKGMDFPKVSFVGVIAADTSLYVSDYKAQERTYQLLTQVSGRAGRFDGIGEAVIQTYTPDNYSIELSKEENYLAFYKKELDLRKANNYPPFVKLFFLRLLSENRSLAYEESGKWIRTMEKMKEQKKLTMEILGPSEQPKIRGEYQFEIVVKCDLKGYDLLLEDMKRVLYNYYRKNQKNEIKLQIDMD
ncbi:primosomal protein N' [Peptoniphilus sp. KCTC 25270]|uniref:primosomal protein N' n=1 Tax=Peptoniphilus sp. KCTC 25270 TaxID=2897414 RepID=UPI001E2D56AB|nr:primosomal protein N' [Peptoniphilus sp. KCTC 25270]MCD1147117.1 primosomal protein N' [Peptoniphilus sp. KCTC 25270]